MDQGSVPVNVNAKVSEAFWQTELAAVIFTVGVGLTTAFN